MKGRILNQCANILNDIHLAKTPRRGDMTKTSVMSSGEDRQNEQLTTMSFMYFCKNTKLLQG